MMNIFRLLGMAGAQTRGLLAAEVFVGTPELILYRGPFPPPLHLDPSTQDEDVERMPTAISLFHAYI